MVIRRPSAGELHELADRNHFTLSGPEVDGFRTLFETILPHYDALEAVPLPTREAPAGLRDAGVRPGADNNPFNAFVRRCLVRGSGAYPGSLDGKRIGIKDSVCIAGVPLTAGSSVLEYLPARDATVVDRILAAGGDIVGVLNMDNLAFSGAGNTSAHGPILNPHSPDHLAGGSSGGSAAALFSGDVDITLGCDQAGSIRIPASWCGVVGLKPTFSLVPYTGILGFDQSFDHVGPLARDAANVALLMDVIAGPDNKDPRQRQVPALRFIDSLRRTDLAGLRIGVLQEGFGSALAQPDVDDRVLAAAERMGSLGAEVTPVRCPEHLAAARVVWGTFAEGVAATFQAGGQGYHWSGDYDPDLSAAFAAGLAQRGEAMPMQCKFNLMLGSHLGKAYHGRYYAKAQVLRHRLRDAYDQLLASCDVLLMPTTPMKAHRHQPGQSPAELVLAGWNMVANTAPFNMTGHPALSVPCGFSAGLPVGLMLVGRHFRDDLLLAIANVFQQRG